MQSIRFFEDGHRFFRGNLHSHTTASDGNLSAEQAATNYRQAGYDFLCFTEHELFTARTELGDENFLVIPAVEWSAMLVDSDRYLKCHHILGIQGTRAMLEAAAKPPYQHGDRMPTMPYDGVATVIKMRDELLAHGCLAIYNHPAWSRVTPADYGLLDGFCGMEIHNYGCELEDFTGFTENQWDQLLSMGSRVRGVATDDNHNAKLPDDSFGGWVMAYAKELSRDAIAQALLDGQFYASTGPEILRYGIVGGKCYVECSPCNQINFVCGGEIQTGTTRWSLSGADDIHYAEHEISGKEAYIRIRCQRKDGKVAWTNPLFV